MGTFDIGIVINGVCKQVTMLMYGTSISIAHLADAKEACLDIVSSRGKKTDDRVPINLVEDDTIDVYRP